VSDEKSPKDLDRRKFFRELLPYIATTFSDYRAFSGALAPERYVMQGLSQRGAPLKALTSVKEEDLLAEVRGMDIRFLGPGVLSLRLTAEQVFGFIEDGLRKHFVREGARVARFARGGPAQASLMLPGRPVEARLIPLLTANEMKRLLEEARTGSFETWIFTTSEAETEIPLDPLFTSENNVQFNHFRVIPLRKLLADVFKSRWDVVSTAVVQDSFLVILNHKGGDRPWPASETPGRLAKQNPPGL
jgi:hypothetical protein